MQWTECISTAINYIEDNITEDLSIEQIARQAGISPYYFQKGFSMLCGFSIAEYIRCRRLALAGSELLSTDKKIIDIALKYGYDSPDSFTKSFVRFHDVTPTAVRKSGAMIKSFSPLKVKLILDGGHSIDYRIVEKDAFTVAGWSQMMSYENAAEEVTVLWKDFLSTEKSDILCCKYGINIDESMGRNVFEYLIADDYNPALEAVEGIVTKLIPAFVWAVFACRGAMPQSMQEVNQMIFSEWLPNSRDYDIAAGYNIEKYSDPAKYREGTCDENYYSELWIPVKHK